MIKKLYFSNKVYECYMGASNLKWVKLDYIEYEVNSLRLEDLRISLSLTTVIYQTEFIWNISEWIGDKKNE